MGVLLSISGNRYPGADGKALVDLARRAEDAGFDGIVVADHVVMGQQTDQYPWGKFPIPEDMPWPEPLTILTAIAAVTERLRLCTGVLIAPLRPAIVLAKAAATLDALSSGRLELGVAVGWQREEFDAAGLNFTARGRMLDDNMGACRALWQPGFATFDSETVTFDGIRCDPQPATPGGPPLLFAGTLNARNLRRIIVMGDGWIPIMGERAQGVGDGVTTLREAMLKAGREPANLRIRIELPTVWNGNHPDLAATLAGAPAFAELGATDTSVVLSAFVRDRAQSADWFAEAARLLSALTPGPQPG